MMTKPIKRRRRTASRYVSLVTPKSIDAKQQDLPTVSFEGWQALQKANEPPRLFVYGSAPIRLVERGADDVAIEVLTVDKFRYELARAAPWCVNSAHGPQPAMPPRDVVRDMLAHPAHPLPELTRITHAPVVVPGPRLLNVAGYDTESQTYYAQPECLVGLEVPARPSRDAVASARRFVLKELLGDFPLVADADRAHALCLLLLPFVRPVVTGPTPLHLVEKPKERTGAGLLVDALLFPATGEPTPVMTMGRNEDETRRILTAKLTGSPTAILIDNAMELRSPALAAAITAPVWTDRVIGTSRDIRLAVECAWVATGINPVLSSEITGRTVRLRLDAQMDHPEERSTFRHPHLREWATEERCRLVQASLTLVQAWIAEGCRHGTAVLGGFESWARVMGGLLDVAGVPGFLQDRPQLYAASDGERAAWCHLIRQWNETFGDRPVGVGDLFSLVDGSRDPIDLDLGHGSERGQKTTFGKLLVAKRDAVIDGFQVAQAGIYQGAQRWRLIPVDQRPEESR